MPTSEKIALLIFMTSFAAVYIIEAALLIRAAAALIKGKSGRGILLKKRALAVHLLAVLGVLFFFYARFIEPTWIEVNTIRIETDKLKTESFRIVHISDLHCDRKVRNEERMAELINGLGADVIVFTGDSLNTADALGLLKETLGNLKASSAKLAVSGNFDVGPWRDLDLFSGTGFRLLDGETAAITKNGESIYVSGLSCDNPGGFSGLSASATHDDFHVFLYHFSDLVESVEGSGIDLYLCGHTHGGQVALPFYGAIITLSKLGKKYESGLYKVGGTMLYVNRGIGLEPRPAPQVRFLARPEIAVFDIGPRK
ncbi:MAG: metallophosphoesterase family protein [Sedimentisphaerales bacterium]|nr:metallophosphoesterase family protein [Sedimentisphaerales bacterium]